MMIKFKKYWEEYSVILAFGAVLDPRFKLNTLVHCYNEIDPISAKDKVELVKSKLYKLFEVYDQNSSTTVESSSQIPSNFSQATSSAIGTQLIKIVGVSIFIYLIICVFYFSYFLIHIFFVMQRI